MADSRPDNPSPQEIELLLRSRAAPKTQGPDQSATENASVIDQEINATNREIRTQALRQPRQNITQETSELENKEEEEEIAEQNVTAVSQETQIEGQKSQARNQQTKNAEDIIKEQVVKQVKKRFWLWLAGATVLNPMFWLALLIGFGIAVMLFVFTMAYSCYQQMGISGTATTAFSAWWSGDPAGAIMDAVTNKCFKSSGGTQAANATAAQTPDRNTGESGSSGGVVGAGEAEGAGEE